MMKRVYSSQNSLLLNHLRNVLESTGIECEIRNDMLAGAAGELPLTECWPELWITDESRLAEAEQRIRETLMADHAGRPLWPCPRCGERIEDQFSQCWHCGAHRPE